MNALIDHIGEKPLRAIDQAYLNTASLEMYGNCTNETRNRQFFTPFIAVWNYASKGNNPLCQPVQWQRPKRIKKRSSNSSKAVSYQDAVTFINAMDINAARVMFFLFWTGCRPIEAFSLTEGINIEDRWIVLDDTKTDTPRGIPIHESLIPLLSKIKDDGGFLNARGGLYPTNRLVNQAGRIAAHRGGQISSPLKTAEEKTGLHITPYQARHTVATNLIYPCGVSETIKNEILGHGSKGDVSLDYIHLPRQAHIDAINKLPEPQGLGLRKDLL